MRFTTLIVLLFLLYLSLVLAAPADPELLKQGELLIRTGDLDAALSLYNAQLDSMGDETPDEYVSQIARILYQTEKTEQGLTFVDEMLEKGRRDADLYYFQGRLFLDSQKSSEAMAAFEKALAVNPNHLGALFGKGMHLKRDFQPPAEDDVEDEKELSEADYAELDRKDREIREIFEKVKTLKPTSADDFEQKVNVFMYEQDIDEAQRWINRAVNRNPFRAPLLLNRCVIGATRGEFDIAKPDCEKALAFTKNPDLIKAINELLDFMEKGGNTEYEDYEGRAEGAEVNAEL